MTGFGESTLREAGATAQRDVLVRTIETLERQRHVLGNEAIDLALAPLLAKLAGRDRQAVVAPLPERVSERKVVTVLFADIAGFTALSERIGSESSVEIVNALFERLVPVVERYGGTIDKFIGDEIMATARSRHGPGVGSAAWRGGAGHPSRADDERDCGTHRGRHGGTSDGDTARGSAHLEVVARVESGSADIDVALSPLAERQLVEPEADGRVRFVHAVVQDVAYDGMLERDRRRLHATVAGILEREASEADVALLACYLMRNATLSGRDAAQRRGRRYRGRRAQASPARAPRRSPRTARSPHR